jgi:hypothetical protein
MIAKDLEDFFFSKQYLEDVRINWSNKIASESCNLKPLAQCVRITTKKTYSLRLLKFTSP